jgi:hypothetical protein
LRVLCPAILLATALLLAGCGSSPASKTQDTHANHQTANTAPGPTPRIPAHFKNPEEAKPLPAVLDPKQFSDPVVVKAYRYAQENPEVFAQQPCYCYCDAGEDPQHRSLLDCYASNHSVGCALCQKEGLLVHKLLAEGKNATEIRDLIVRGEWQAVKLE